MLTINDAHAAKRSFSSSPSAAAAAAAAAATAAEPPLSAIADILRRADRSLPLELVKRYELEVSRPACERNERLVSLLTYIFSQYNAVRNELNFYRDIAKVTTTLALRFSDHAMPIDLALDECRVTSSDVLTEIVRRSPAGYESLDEFLRKRGADLAAGLGAPLGTGAEQSFARRYAMRVLLSSLKRCVFASSSDKAAAIRGQYFERFAAQYDPVDENDRCVVEREYDRILTEFSTANTRTSPKLPAGIDDARSSTPAANVNDGGGSASAVSNNADDEDLRSVSTVSFLNMMERNDDLTVSVAATAAAIGKNYSSIFVATDSDKTMNGEIDTSSCSGSSSTETSEDDCRSAVISEADVAPAAPVDEDDDDDNAEEKEDTDTLFTDSKKRRRSEIAAVKFNDDFFDAIVVH